MTSLNRGKGEKEKPRVKMVLSKLCDCKEDNEPRTPWSQEGITIFTQGVKFDKHPKREDK